MPMAAVEVLECTVNVGNALEAMNREINIRQLKMGDVLPGNSPFIITVYSKKRHCQLRSNPLHEAILT